MALTWNLEFIKSVPGMLMVGQVGFAILGGIVNIFSPGLATGLLGFVFWSTAIISGVLLLCHVCNLIQMIESKFPAFSKVQIGYLVVWIVLYIISCILSFVGFGFSAIFAYIVIILMVVDGGFRYRAYRASVGGGGDSAAASASPN